ncbi:MAG TPA: divalent-cation tolerance protein CutA [Candidatus Bathyarchaeota archaeon]|nr:divalent-cation tolerance protein CutA [Candidatus Bathyarchaeota archaeon]
MLNYHRYGFSLGRVEVYMVVLSTASDEEEARQIARELLEERLAACVSIFRRVYSLYHWQGRVEESSESLMIIKTREDRVDEVIATIRRLHSYQTPEIIALPVEKGLKEYLDWIDAALEGKV